MTADRWEKIKELLSAAHALPNDERDAFLKRSCAGDRKLLDDVSRLLNSYSTIDSFLEHSAAADFANLFASDFDDPEITISLASPPRFEPGAVLNERYEISSLLGRGGMGEVYLAMDSRINRNVALKVLHPDLVSSKESLRRFSLEAQAVSALNHPHIVTIYDFETTGDGTLFIVAEYVEGKTLNRLIGNDLDLDKILDIAIQAASALSAAHEAGITHRDIKPENVMVRRDGYIKVLDFGLAKLTQERAPSAGAGSEAPTHALPRTKPGMIVGTAAYMSPEQARGLHVDARTDVWSLGAVLYEMLTGRRPFSGETQADVIVAVLLGEPTPISQLVSGVPAELERIVERALSKEAGDRYPTIEELRIELGQLRRQTSFDDSLIRSGDAGVPWRDPSEAATVITVPENPDFTDGDAQRATGGGQDVAHRPLWSSSGLASFYETARTHKVRTSVAAMIFLALISAGSYFAVTRWTPASNEIDSIAVLPFENLSGDPDLAYVSDGLSGNLIDRLAQLPQLKVTSRNSSFKFRGANPDLRSIASQLGVRAIVTGSVARVGEDVRVRIDVIDAVEDKQLTGGQYDRKIADLVKIQTDVAQSAFEALRSTLTKTQTDRLARNATENSEAYRYYLSGLVEVNGPQDVRGNALDYFEKAVALDPSFAAAYAEIGWIYWGRANAGTDTVGLVQKAKIAVERALEIDPDLAKAHTVRAMLYEFDFDWQNAEQAYRRSIELSPNLDFARNNYAFFLSVMGRHEEALAELEQQRIRDPINQRLLLLHRAIVLTQARNFDGALRAYQDAQAVEPNRAIPSFALGYAYAGKGLHREATGYYKKSVEILGGETEYSQPLIYLAAAYARMPDKRSDARTILKRIEHAGEQVSPALLAIVYASLDDNDRAMMSLERAYIQRDLFLKFIGSGYEYDGLRSDPRFVDLTKRLGFTK